MKREMTLTVAMRPTLEMTTTALQGIVQVQEESHAQQVNMEMKIPWRQYGWWEKRTPETAMALIMSRLGLILLRLQTNTVSRLATKAGKQRLKTKLRL